MAFDGEFVNNKRNGVGTFTWGNGDMFKGQFLDNMMHGEGTFEWNDGRKYEGLWARN
jgi:hypothetical protein